MNLRRWSGLAILAAVAALWWALRATAPAPPEVREARCMSVEELSRAPEGTRASCCELAGANRTLGGQGDWQSGVSLGTGDRTGTPRGAPRCPCGCPSGTACADVRPWMQKESDAAATVAGAARLSAEGTAFCHGPRLGRCLLSPAKAAGPREAGRSTAPAECKPLADAVKAHEGEVVRICEWIGPSEHFAGTGDWALLVVHADPDGARWKSQDRPACPCGCGLGKGCGALTSGRGLAAFCTGATRGGCPRAPQAKR